MFSPLKANIFGLLNLCGGRRKWPTISVLLTPTTTTFASVHASAFYLLVHDQQSAIYISFKLKKHNNYSLTSLSLFQSIIIKLLRQFPGFFESQSVLLDCIRKKIGDNKKLNCKSRLLTNGGDDGFGRRPRRHLLCSARCAIVLYEYLFELFSLFYFYYCICFSLCVCVYVICN